MQNNVVFIIFDTLRRDAIWPYAKAISEPNIEAFAKEANIFPNAISPSSWTLPAHGSLFTGMYPSRCGVKESTIDDVDYSNQYSFVADKALPAVIRSRGYNTLAFSQNILISPDNAFSIGFDSFKYTNNPFQDHFFQMLETYNHLMGNWGKSIKSILTKGELINFLKTYKSLKKNTKWLQSSDYVDKGGHKVLDELQKTNLNEPFFLFLNFMEIHDPLDSVSLKLGWQDSVFASESISREQKKIVREAYFNKAPYLDGILGRITQILKSRNLLDNTMIILTSDHGQSLFENGNYYAHGNFLYPELVEMPLMIRMPKGKKFNIKNGYQSTTRLYDFILSNIEDNGAYDSISSESAYSEAYGSLDKRIPKYSGREDFQNNLNRVNAIRKKIYKGGFSLTADLSHGLLESFEKNNKPVSRKEYPEIYSDLLEDMKIFYWNEDLIFPK